MSEATVHDCPDCPPAGGPVHPPAEWFADPGLNRHISSPTVTADGRVFGHVAPWNTCHVGIEASCVTAPREDDGYPYFHLGSLRTAEGSDLAVGKITLGTGHADRNLGFVAASEHYDNTGTVVADVAVGNDGIGVWVAGALRPGVSAEQIRALRAAPLSGDWRWIGGDYRLMAALAVNVPGFTLPRPLARVASGEHDHPALILGGVGQSASEQQVEALTAALRPLLTIARRDALARIRVSRSPTAPPGA